MRPTAIQPSMLNQPFNQLLGTRTGVRIFRVLSRARAPLARAEVARRAQLNDAGVRRTLDMLVDFGIVESVAIGTQAVQLKRGHPLAGPLISLFNAEWSYLDSIRSALGAAAMAVVPAPISAWVDGVESYGRKDGRGLVLNVVVGSRESDAASTQLLAGIHRYMAKFDVNVTARVLTKADIAAGLGPTGEPDDLIVVVAPHPADLLRRDTVASEERTHADHDRHQLRIARVVADRLANDPDLLHRTVAYLRRQLTPDLPATDPGVEWLSYLEHQSTARIREMLVDEGETATRLRQSLPFLSALSDSERGDLLQQVTNDEE